MEFQLRQENISIVIMPLPMVYTEKTPKLIKLKPNLTFKPWITSEVSTWLAPGSYITIVIKIISSIVLLTFVLMR